MSVLYQNQAGFATCAKRKAVKMVPQVTFLARGHEYFLFFDCMYYTTL